MPVQIPPFIRKRIAMTLTLVILLASVYMLTYSGRIESSDTRALADAISSFVQYGDTDLDISAWYTYPPPTARGIYPLAPIDTEPLQPILAAPLYWIAVHLPGIGLNHAIWLFNIGVCGLAGGVLFLYALALGYSEATGVLVTILFGLGTIIWPYSKTFFREPLALLMILLSALFIERCRAGRFRSLIWLGAAILALIGAWWSKEAIVFALPALLILLAPAPHFDVFSQRLMKVFLLAVIAAVSAFWLLSVVPGTDNLNALYRAVAPLVRKYPADIANIHAALHAYLLSIGGSFWGTSPVLLLAVPGLWILYRRGQYRYIIALIVIVLTFVVGYAVLRGRYWFGGLAWPPRFLVPIIPLLMLGTLPVLDQIIGRSAQRWLIWLSIVLAVYSLWVQLSGLLLPWETYTFLLPPEAGGLGEWWGGLNQVQYLRWALLPAQWSVRPLDLAWVRVSTPWWPMAFIALIVLCAVQLSGLLRRESMLEPRARRLHATLTAVLPVLFLLLVGLSLRAIYRDPFYLGDRDSLLSFLPIIESVGQTNDILLLDSTNYAPFFMNYDKFRDPRVITLPDQPGEQPSPEQPAQIKSDNPDALITKITAPLIQNLAATREHFWLLEDAGPWLPWRVRPIERYMAAHYYPIQELSTTPPDPTVRMIEFSTVNAPDPYSFRGPEHLMDLVYGGLIHLTGFTLPRGTSYQAGDILPISFYWQADQKVGQNYTVAWFLVKDDSSRVVQATDYQPVWGFAPTSIWQPGVPIWDNRGLHIPSDLEAGQYQLWVRLYQSDSPDKVLSVSGSMIQDEDTGVLPTHIDIKP